MNIDAPSNMRFGDAEGMRDFFFVHRLVHIEVDAAITQGGGGAMPNATLDNETALAAWVRAMAQGSEGDLAPTEERAIVDWLQWHDSLHQAEYEALALGESPDLAQADFREESQFYAWMYAHQAVHQTLSQITGVS